MTAEAASAIADSLWRLSPGDKAGATLAADRRQALEDDLKWIHP